MGTVLAALMSRAGRIVSAWCTRFWVEKRPLRANTVLHVYISQLRKPCARAPRSHTTPPISGSCVLRASGSAGRCSSLQARPAAASVRRLHPSGVSSYSIGWALVVRGTCHQAVALHRPQGLGAGFWCDAVRRRSGAGCARLPSGTVHVCLAGLFRDRGRRAYPRHGGLILGMQNAERNDSATRGPVVSVGGSDRRAAPWWVRLALVLVNLAVGSEATQPEFDDDRNRVKMWWRGSRG
jgi:hypothetical protein